jgi:hypothetical protein
MKMEKVEVEEKKGEKKPKVKKKAERPMTVKEKPVMRREDFDNEIEGQYVLLILANGEQYTGKVTTSRFWYKLDKGGGKAVIISKGYVKEIRTAQAT